MNVDLLHRVRAIVDQRLASDFHKSIYVCIHNIRAMLFSDEEAWASVAGNIAFDDQLGVGSKSREGIRAVWNRSSAKGRDEAFGRHTNSAAVGKAGQCDVYLQNHVCYGDRVVSIGLCIATRHPDAHQSSDYC